MGECKTMELPEPVFEEFAFRFRATISLVPEQESELDEVTQKNLFPRSASLSPEAADAAPLTSKSTLAEAPRKSRTSTS